MKKVIKALGLLAGGFGASLVSAENFQMQHPFPGFNLPADTASQGFSKIDCGVEHCYGLKNGTVWGVGDNRRGQLGQGHTTSQNNWVETTFTGVSDISAGGYFGYAIKDGEVWAVGENFRGQLALGHTTSQSNWVTTGLTNVIDISAGNQHGYALLASGDVKAVGHNTDGQLGIGNMSTSSAFNWRDTNMTGASDVEAGGYHGYAIQGGTVWSVGDNRWGQLGLGNNTDMNAWQPTTLTGVSALAAGRHFGYALKGDEVWSTGMDNNGQLARAGGTSNSWGQATSQATAIAAGDLSGYAIRDGGEVHVAGWGGMGQLGYGGTANQSYFYNSGLTGVDQIIAASYSAYAIQGDKVLSTGKNEYGALGLGDNTDRATWTEVTLP